MSNSRPIESPEELKSFYLNTKKRCDADGIKDYQVVFNLMH